MVVVLSLRLFTIALADVEFAVSGTVLILVTPRIVLWLNGEAGQRRAYYSEA